MQEEKLKVMTLVTISNKKKVCHHNLTSTVSCCVSVGEETFCAIIDTGAQVSLVSEDTFKLLKRKDKSLILHEAGEVLTGIDRAETPILGIIEMRLALLGTPVKSTIPFAVVRTRDMPCCCILGANFLSLNEFTVDFALGLLSSPVGEIVCPLNKEGNNDLSFRYNIAALCCSLTETSSLSDVSDETEDNRDSNIKFSISQDRLIDL
jgi:hypothetical protein